MLRRVHPVELAIGSQGIRLGRRPLLMGIVNVTPDSFSDGGRFFEASRAIAHAESLLADGADWLDVGGESTRPGAEPVGEREELRRVMPVIERLAGAVEAPISIDTYKPAVAKEALAAGAAIINDVTGFRDPAMIELAAETGAACVCMHMIGTPRTMQAHADYADVVTELSQFFTNRLDKMSKAGIDLRRIVIDPGIGFAKKRRHNVEILRRLGELLTFDRPLLLGASRKRIVGELTGRSEGERLYGSIGAAVVGYAAGAHVLRVHDVGPVSDTLAFLGAVDFDDADPPVS